MLKRIILLLTIPFVVGVSKKESVTFDNVAKNFQLKSPKIEKRREGQTFKGLKEGELPIVGFGFIPSEHCAGANNPDFLNKTNVGYYKDAGFNLVSAIYEFQNYNTKQLRRALDICEELDIGYVARDQYIYGTRAYEPVTEHIPTVEEFEDHIKDLWITEHPAFRGFDFIDEPTPYNFERIGNAQKAIDNLLPGTINFTTLFPSYGRGYYGMGIDTEETKKTVDKWDIYDIYLNRFIDECNPQLLIDEHYMFYRNDEEEIDPVKNEQFFKSLSWFRKKSKAAGIPYWGTASSSKHWAKEPHYTNEIKWAINMCLSYGAQGLEYYTYWPVIENRDVFNMEKSNYYAFTTPNGVLNDHYYVVQSINNFAHTIEDVLMGAEHKGMLQYGNKKVSIIPKEDNLKSYGPLQNIKCNSAMVGCFNNHGKPAYMVVCDSIDSGYELFDFSFSKNVNLRVRSIEGGEEYYNNVRSFAEFLSAGEACMVEVL